MGVVVDGSSSDVEAMIAETGVGGFTHLSGDEASALTAEHRVSGIPHFVFIDGTGSTDTLAGWSHGQFTAKLDWLRS